MAVQPFTLVRPATDGDVPQDVADLIAREGVPASILPGMYEVASQVTLLPIVNGEDPSRSRLASFGAMNLFGAICIDCQTYEIVRKASIKTARRVYVNATLSQFNRSARALLDHWPFYHMTVDDQDNDDMIEWAVAADALEESLAAIDPTSVEFGNYWAETVSEVKFGQFSVEEKLDYNPPWSGA